MSAAETARRAEGFRRYVDAIEASYDSLEASYAMFIAGGHREDMDAAVKKHHDECNAARREYEASNPLLARKP